MTPGSRAAPAPADTTPAAAAEQARLFAEMDPAERVRAAIELSVAARRMTLAGLARRFDGLSDDELKDRLIGLCYGSTARP